MQLTNGVNKTGSIQPVAAKPTKLRRIRITDKILEEIRTINMEGWIHVISYNGIWKVRKHGAERASGVYADKESAIAAAKKALKAVDGTAIFVHDANGNVEQTIHK